MSIERIGIIGAGAWGTALAGVAAQAGRAVTIWALEPEVAEAINTGHENRVYLPEVALDPQIRATTDLAEAAGADAVLLAAPTQHLRSVTERLAPHLAPATPVVICAKGIENESHALLSDVIAETLPGAVPAVLSGPTFAREVANGLPTAVTLACRDEICADALVQALGGRTFRPYRSADLTGAQIGGAVKNVMAIACGIVSGRDFGDNARAALITRGFAEILRFGVAMGAKPETLMGLSGLGDLVLTATSSQSRNMSLGLALAKGENARDYLAARRSVAEGAHTASALCEMAQARGIEMPIALAVDRILNHGAEIDAEIAGLLARPFKAETG